MVKKFKVEKNTMEVSSLWGGLIYIIVPKESTLGQISVTIKDAVEAPFFRLGKWSQNLTIGRRVKKYFCIDGLPIFFCFFVVVYGEDIRISNAPRKSWCKALYFSVQKVY